MDPEPVPHCSFCNKSQAEVKRLITGPTANICDECIDVCEDILLDPIATPPSPAPPPSHDRSSRRNSR